MNVKPNNPMEPLIIYSNTKDQKDKIFKDNKNKSGIYCWVNNVNGKSYISSAVNLGKRLKEHYRRYKSNIIIQ